MRLRNLTKVTIVSKLVLILACLSVFSCRTRQSSSTVRTLNDISADLDRALTCSRAFLLEAESTKVYDPDNIYGPKDYSKITNECRGNGGEGMKFTLAEPDAGESKTPKEPKGPTGNTGNDPKSKAKEALDKALELDTVSKRLDEAIAKKEAKLPEWKAALKTVKPEDKDKLERDIFLLESEIETAKLNKDFTKKSYDSLADEVRSQGLLLSNVEKGVLKIVDGIRNDVQTRPILRKEDTDKIINSMSGKEFLGSMFATFPRAEIKYRETTGTTDKYNLGADFVALFSRGITNVFPASKAFAESPTVSGVLSTVGITAKSKIFGYTVSRKYGIQVSVAGQGSKSLLTEDGFFTRAVSVICQVFVNDSIEKSVGFEVGASVVGLSGGYNYDSTHQTDIEGYRIGNIKNIPLGGYVKDDPENKKLPDDDERVKREARTIWAEIKDCRAYAEKIKREDPIESDLKAAYEALSDPRTNCFDDYDCRDELTGSKSNVRDPENFRNISECRLRKDLGINVCSDPLPLEGGKCILETREDLYEVACARGLYCNYETRKCAVKYELPRFESVGQEPEPGKLIRSPEIAMKIAKLSEVKYLNEVRFRIVETKINGGRVRKIMPGDETKISDRICASAFGESWRLPAKSELWAVAVFDREATRTQKKAELLQADQAIGNFYYSQAKDWYYVPKAFEGYIWSSEKVVWNRSLSSVTVVSMETPESLRKLLKSLDAKVTEVSGAAYCVR